MGIGILLRGNPCDGGILLALIRISEEEEAFTESVGAGGYKWNNR